jgi:exonuclease III
MEDNKYPSGLISQQSQCISFNCDGFSNNWHAVHHLLVACQADVVAIQEHWLAPAQLHQLHSLAASCGFACICSSAMEERVASGVVKGRGHGGLAIFTRCAVVRNVKRVSIASTRLLAAQFMLADRPFLLIDAYLPYNSNRDTSAMVDYLE